MQTVTSMTALIRHIEKTHHEYLRRELPQLENWMTQAAILHGQAHPELNALARVLRRFSDDLHDHMDKEENILFPAIRRMEAEGQRLDLDCPIRVMIEEHAAADADLAEMRSLTSGYTVPATACPVLEALYHGLRELEEDMRRHVHAENDMLFPAARAFGG